jgi:S-DNA-T family DNA segregation ATPase FtsK/SpoIIIE
MRGWKPLAAKRKKRLKTSLKYEVYGILLIFFSVVALAGTDEIAGMGSVGHAFNYLFYTLAGRFHFVFPLVGIYVGLYVMMKRQWPKQWTYRKSGLVLILLGFTIHSHANLYEGIPAEARSVGRTVLMPIDNLRMYLSGEIDASMFLDALGGGLAGAVLYGLLYFLFADGVRFITYLLWVIGFICVTGWTLADVVQFVRNGLRGSSQAARARFRDLKLLFGGNRKTGGTRLQAKPADLVLEDGLDEESLPPKPKNGQGWKWFSLIGGKEDAHEAASRNHRDEEDDDDWDEEENRPVSVLIGYRDEETPDERMPDGDHPDEDDPDQEDVWPEEDSPPVRDFADQDMAFQDPEAEEEELFDDAEEDGEFTDPLVSGDDAGSGEPGQQPSMPYTLPSLSLLDRPSSSSRSGDLSDTRANARKLEATLESFGVRAKVLEVVRGPAVTRYEIQPDTGVKVSRIVSLTDDIALALAAKDIRMEAPIPGKSAIGIEVPNTEVSIVTLREVMETPAFQDSEAKLTIALGRDISGQPIVANLARMPHLLVAGATGSGKSVCINGIIVSILYKARPDEVKFLMIDPKKVELNMYNGIPHLLAPVVTDPRRASLALKQVVKEMERRYELFAASGTRNLEGYNQLVRERETGEEPLPYIVVIVDELADLMMVAAHDVEDSICRLAQMARAAGIHLIIATQRPSVDVITGLIKANIPSRIAFGVSSQVDSRTILDTAGAEKLLGRGDMLFVPVGANKAIRVQGAFLSDHEVESVVNFVKNQGQAEYREDLVPEADETAEADGEMEDELFDQAAQIVLEARQASVSLLQRRLRIGYNRAARLIDAMEARGIVGPYEGSKPREVLMTMEQYREEQRKSS